MLFLTHLTATLFMVGVIWFVQIVHYPLFDRVGPSVFTAYSDAHSRLTTYVVGPPMLLELSTGVLLLLFRPANVPAAVLWVGLALIAVIWLSTAFLQVPRHEILRIDFDSLPGPFGGRWYSGSAPVSSLDTWRLVAGSGKSNE
jgi:uncharacterized membrane protein